MELSVSLDAGSATVLAAAMSMLAAWGGAGIAGVVALCAAILNNRHQNKLRRLQELRQLRDRKYERVRTAASALLALAETMNEIIGEQKRQREGESVEQRDARLTELWRGHAARANAAMIDLSLDIDADHIVEAYHQTRQSFQRYQQDCAEHLKDRSSVPWPREHEAAFRRGMSTLREVIRDTLATLEAPVEEAAMPTSEATKVTPQ